MTKIKELRLLKKKADESLSKYVRKQTTEKYGQCPLCKEDRNRPVQACFHFVRRRRAILRWDIRNCIGSCHGCNYVEYRNPDPSRAWFIREYGVDKYLKLVDESKKDFEVTKEYLEGIIKKYEKD
jgi:hypothetical protein